MEDRYRLRLKSKQDLLKEFFQIISIEKTELPEKAKSILIEIEDRIKADIEKEKEQMDCKHPRNQRSYIGAGFLKCNKCGNVFR